MKILQDIFSKIEELRRVAELPARPAGAIPSQDDKDLATYVKDLWEDAQQFQTRYYQQTKHLRRSKPDEKGAGVGFSFDTWKKAAEALAYGENWEYVWGHRPENWMKERVDGEIPRKISVRKVRSGILFAWMLAEPPAHAVSTYPMAVTTACSTKR